MQQLYISNSNMAASTSYKQHP